MRMNSLVTASLLAAITSGAIASCPIPFDPALPLSVGGGGTYDSVLTDFNNDGRLDIAAVNFSSHNISIRLAVSPPTAIGTFHPSVNYSVGTSPRSLASGDFNHDGNADLAVANGSTLNVSILLGVGNGTFSAAVNYHVGTQPQGMLSRDLNNDGHLDLIIAHAFGIGILLGNPNGTFQPVTVIPATQPLTVDVADFNSDGRLDLVVQQYENAYVAVFLGLPGGTFAAPATYPTGFGPLAVAAGDVNGDGRPDVVTANYVANSISVLIANPDGSLQPRMNYLANAQRPAALSLIDLNSDDRLDVVTANFSGNNMSVFRNSGDGTFFAPILHAAGTSPFGVAVGDINNDGTPDISIANQPGGVSLFLNRYCPADFDCDGTSDFFDYLDFVDRFSQNHPSADYNVDGIIDFFDYLDFVQDFQILCP